MNYAWILEIRPGYEEEYKKRHDEIWPEMVQMLKEAGLRNYNIFRYGITVSYTHLTLPTKRIV